MADSNPRRKRWFTVLGVWASTSEQLVELVKAKNPLEAATMVRKEHSSDEDDPDLEITSVHPGRILPCVPDVEWESVNTPKIID